MALGRLAVALVATLIATACSGSGSGTQSSASRGPTSQTPDVSQTPSPSQRDVAIEAATALVYEFYKVRNVLRQDSQKPLRALDAVAVSTELAAQLRLFKAERRQGLHQTGETKIAGLDVQSVDLDNLDPKVGKVPTVQVDVCFDVSGVDIVDAAGQSAVGPDRPKTGWIRYLVSNYK
jgi:hypothetical protein